MLLRANQEHRQWLDNVLDRHALRSAATPKTAIFSEELATQIQEHFGDIVDFLNTQQNLKDDEADDL